MATYSEDWLVSDSAAAPPASPLVVPPQEGIGLEPPMQHMPKPVADPRSEAIARMGTGEKFLTALGEFGAGVTGQASPLNRRVLLQQQEKEHKLREAKVNQDALEDSAKWYERLPEGPEREKFVETRVAQLNQQSPGLGDQFKAFSAKPSLITRFREYEEFLPDHLKLMLRTDPEGFRKAMATTEGMKALETANDRRVLRMATRKGQAAIMGWDKFAPPDVVTNYKKDGIITATEFRDVQQYLPKEARMSDEEMEVAMRTPGFWRALNIAGPDEEADARKKRLGEGPQSDVGRLRSDLDAGRITQKEYDDRLKKMNASDKEERLTPATISVNGKNVSALVNSKGEYFDANTRERVSGKIAPAITEADERRNRELAGRAEGADNLEKAVNALDKIAKNHPRSAAGLFSAPARGIEYVAGSLNPGGTGTSPATQAVQLRDTILQSMGNLSRMSNEDRKRIENALQVGTGGNPRNLPLAIELLRDNIRKERAELGAGSARPKPAGGKKKPSEMSDAELLEALTGGGGG